MTPARCYRRCSVCGLRWNVSRLVQGPERYVCPRCAGQKGVRNADSTR